MVKNHIFQTTQYQPLFCHYNIIQYYIGPVDLLSILSQYLDIYLKHLFHVILTQFSCVNFVKVVLCIWCVYIYMNPLRKLLGGAITGGRGVQLIIIFHKTRYPGVP